MTDAGVLPELEVFVISARFEVCNCHHGFGPGYDGAMVISVVNPRGEELAAALGGIALVAEDGTAFPASSIQSRPWYTGKVAPGDNRFDLVVYGDLPEARPGRYTVRVMISGRTFGGRGIDVPLSR